MIITRDKVARELREIADWVESGECDRIRLTFEDQHENCTLVGGYRVGNEWINFIAKENWGIIPR